MSVLTAIEARVAALLQDITYIAFTTDEIDEAIRSALADYNRVAPLETVTVITLTTTGREIKLNSITALATITGVLDVWWPWYTTGGEVWPPNRLEGFRTYKSGSDFYLFLTSKDCNQPVTGDKMKVWWIGPHTINGLDSATATTLSTDGEALVVQGAAGYAALSGALDRDEVLDREVLRKWGDSNLSDFNAKLEKIRASSARTGGEPFGAGWKMDKWDIEN